MGIEIEGVSCFAKDGTKVFVPCVKGKTSDGYHTFDELYEHRLTLFCALLSFVVSEYHHVLKPWKSRKHSGGDGYDGWFIAGVELPGLGQVSYHLSDKYWDLMKVQELEFAPEWDGHTSDDVLQRLQQWIREEV